MVDAYSQIHCLEDIGMIAGSYKVLYIDCYDTDNAAVDLSKATAYGCKFYYYGTATEAFSVTGAAVSGVSNRMKIEIASSATSSLGDCCLSYVPYVTSGSNTTKYGKGRIVVEA